MVGENPLLPQFPLYYLGFQWAKPSSRPVLSGRRPLGSWIAAFIWAPIDPSQTLHFWGGFFLRVTRDRFRWGGRRKRWQPLEVITQAVESLRCLPVILTIRGPEGRFKGFRGNVFRAEVKLKHRQSLSLPTCSTSAREIPKSARHP